MNLPSLKSPRIRLGLGVAVIAVGASACNVVHFNYGDVDPIPPWDAEAYVQQELGPGTHIVNGIVHDAQGRPMICNTFAADGSWVANGHILSPDGPLTCG